MHLAAQYGHRSTAEVLLRAGICKDARTKVDRTPLHMAATEGHELIVDLLIRVRHLFTTSTHISLCRECVPIHHITLYVVRINTAQVAGTLQVA